MNRSPTLSTLGVLLAVLALAAGAGSLAGLDLDPGVDVDGTGDAEPKDSGRSDKNSPGSSGNGEQCLVCNGVTARSLLGLLVAPLSPLGLAVVTVLVGLAAFAYLRGERDAVIQPVDDELADPVDHEPRPGIGTVEQPYDLAGDNFVYRAFERLTTSVPVDDPPTTTPTEYRQAAVRAGYDSEAVAAITETFERVRYGDGESTAGQRQRVQTALDDLDLPEVSDG